MDKWNQYKNALRDMLTKPTGTVDMEDGNGTIVTLPTFPQLQKDVTGLTDSLTGAVAQAGDLVNQSRVYADNASGSADASAASASAAHDAEVAAQAHETSSANSAYTAGSQASAASASSAAAAASASTASDKAAAASSSAATATAQANNAGFSAAAADSSKAQAESSAGLALQYANASVNVEVEPGRYSAFHWAEQARLIAAGALIYRGTWAASMGAYPANPKVGDFYVVSAAGSVGGVQYATGDMVLYDGTQWDRVDNQQAVTSVAGRIGAVTLSISDVSGLQGALDGKMGSGSTVSTTGNNKWLALSNIDGKTYGLFLASDSSVILTYNWTHQLSISDAGVLVDGQTVWHAGNFNPSTKLDLSANAASATKLTATGYSPGNDANNPGGGPPSGVQAYGFSGGSQNTPKADWATLLSVTPFGNGDRTMQLAYSWNYADSFAMRVVGGVWRSLWHDGNFNPASKADSGHTHTNIGRLLDGQPLGASTACTISDWNSATTNGWYMGSNVANAPTASWYIGQVTIHNGGWITQEVWEFTSGSTPQPRFIRNLLNGAWTGWYRIDTVKTWVQSGDPGTAAKEGDLWVW